MEATHAVEGRQPSESNEMAGTAAIERKNDLNFGWFTLPPSSQEERPASSGSNSERDKTKQEVPSETILAGGQFSQGEPDPYNYYHDPDPAGGRSPTAQGGGDHRDLEGGGTPLAVPEHGEDACSWQDASNVAAGYSNEIIVDWPLSGVAMEQAQRLKLTRSDDQPRLPSTFTRAPHVGHSIQVPPTPLPPINWQGYRESTRPTFRTWRDDWHTTYLGNPPHSDHNNNKSSTSASLVDDCDDSDGKNTSDLEIDVEAMMNIVQDQDQDDDHQDSCTGISDGPFNPKVKVGRSKVVPMKFKIPATKNVTKPVYKSRSITQVEERSLAPKRKSSILTTAKSLLKFSCWHRAKSGQVKLLAYKKLAEDQGNDYNNDGSVNRQRQTYSSYT